jgi:hypothetical protein
MRREGGFIIFEFQIHNCMYESRVGQENQDVLKD